MPCHCPICEERDEVFCIRLDLSVQPDALARLCTGEGCPWVETLCGWEGRHECGGKGEDDA